MHGIQARRRTQTDIGKRDRIPVWWEGLEPPSTPEAGLAIGVIRRAMDDADGRLFLQRPRGWAKHRHTPAGALYCDTVVLQAIQFLTESNPDLTFWCAVTQRMQPDALITACRRRYRRKLQQYTALQARGALSYVRSTV